MELEAEISEITLRRLVWRCLVCTDIVFFFSLFLLRQIGSCVCCAWKKVFFFFLSNIKDVIPPPSRARYKSPSLWAAAFTSSSDLYRLGNNFSKDLSSVVSLWYFTSSTFEKNVFLALLISLLTLCALTKRVCFLGQIILFISSKSAAFRRVFFFFTVSAKCNYVCCRKFLALQHKCTCKHAVSFFFFFRAKCVCCLPSSGRRKVMFASLA